ncbi:MAG: hypothetical protein HOI54_00005 [Candidatus Marinimicrobia bacterium]|jgi:hypothetical protein|nr:hypothetical protein [Candidatus Neomarinimicrobiota bacterium]
MDSAENNQAVAQAFEKAKEGSSEEAANNILNMWESENDQPTGEETEVTTEDEVVAEDQQEDEVETEEVSEEEEASEEVETEDTGEEETEEVAEESNYTIKVDGEEYEVNLEELKAGYQRQSDYTRKSQALAEGRKENEAIQSERIRLEQERQMYANGLQMLKEQQSAKLQEFKDVDWSTLKEEDPYAYMLKKDEYRDAQDKARNAAQQQQIVQQQQQQQEAQSRATFVQDQYSQLVNALPEWDNKESTVKEDIRKFAISSGYAPEEVDQLADHRSVLILKKAMEFDKLTKKVAPKKKAIKKVPKVQKSGRGKVKSEAADDKTKKKRARLRKSGHQDDAASVFYDML